jgi:low density lipoprotein receptor-related protein 5/6
MYWTSPPTQDIKRANLDGSDQETVLSNLPRPHGIALDVSNGKMYWADADGGDIRRANFDGSGQEILVKGLASPHGISLDVSGGKVYWVDARLWDGPFQLVSRRPLLGLRNRKRRELGFVDCDR